MYESGNKQARRFLAFFTALALFAITIFVLYHQERILVRITNVDGSTCTGIYRREDGVYIVGDHTDIETCYGRASVFSVERDLKGTPVKWEIPGSDPPAFLCLVDDRRDGTVTVTVEPCVSDRSNQLWSFEGTYWMSDGARRAHDRFPCVTRVRDTPNNVWLIPMHLGEPRLEMTACIPNARRQEFYVGNRKPPKNKQIIRPLPPSIF